MLHVIIIVVVEPLSTFHPYFEIPQLDDFADLGVLSPTAFHAWALHGDLQATARVSSPSPIMREQHVTAAIFIGKGCPTVTN